MVNKMTLKFLTTIVLPEHTKPGGFDHAAVYRKLGRLYVAHTANDALDVIDCATDRYLRSIPGLTGVAGALVSEESELVFTSNRGEDSVGIFSPRDETGLVKVPVGCRPNGLTFDPGRGILLVANVGDPSAGRSPSISFVDVKRREMMADFPVPGRTRWAVYDARSDCFYVNIADPAVILVIAAGDLSQDFRRIEIPAAGPHGLDLDAGKNRLYCACDAKALFTVDLDQGKAGAPQALSGKPDVVFFNPHRSHLYAASGEPGVIDVFDTNSMKLIQTVVTENGAHTIGFDQDRGKVYAFMPISHAAAVYFDEE